MISRYSLRSLCLKSSSSLFAPSGVSSCFYIPVSDLGFLSLPAMSSVRPSARDTNPKPKGVIIDKRDFDSPSRPLLRDASLSDGGASGSRDGSARRYIDDDASFMSDVVDGIIERDRRKMKRELIRWFSFFCAVLSWYVSAASMNAA